MHECPDCGQTCDCDGEDVWNDWAGRTCRHACDDEEPMNPLAEKLGISIEKAGVWRITPDGLERIEEQPVIRCAINPRWTGKPRRKAK